MTIYDDKTIARFWKYVDRRGPNECWEWFGARVKGYGQLKLGNSRRKRGAHVIAYETHKGPAEGLFVCHTCDNPPCCNPAHLWLGTNTENQRDSVDKGRRPIVDRSGEKNARAVLTEENVIAIRRLIASGHYNTEIARTFGVTHSMISTIRLGKSWKHLPVESTALQTTYGSLRQPRRRVKK